MNTVIAGLNSPDSSVAGGGIDGLGTAAVIVHLHDIVFNVVK